MIDASPGLSAGSTMLPALIAMFIVTMGMSCFSDKEKDHAIVKHDALADRLGGISGCA